MSNRRPIITLLTDFGLQDYFAGAMKAVILSTCPRAQIVDITHEIPPQDVRAAAFNLLACYRDFPAGTIHVAVVDPGVGSNRRAILIECADQIFIGPDNGLFSWICEREGDFRARELTNDTFFRQPISPTFHGRDIFAPVAVAISNGVDPQELGTVIDDLVSLERLEPQSRDQSAIAGIILHIDRFGNCITNFTREQFEGNQPRLIINGREINSFRKFFSETSSSNEDLFMIVGSAGFVEIAAQAGSAASILNAKAGEPVMLIAQKTI